VEIETQKTWETPSGWQVVLRSVGRRAFFSIYRGGVLLTSTPDMDGVEKVIGDEILRLHEVGADAA
jgi:hypothetical protein